MRHIDGSRHAKFVPKESQGARTSVQLHDQKCCAGRICLICLRRVKPASEQDARYLEALAWIVCSRD